MAGVSPRAVAESLSRLDGDAIELICLIGQGSYGEVWLGQAEGGFCAVKIVRRQSFADDRPYEREFAGIQKFAPLSHSYDSQIRILNIGRDDRQGFFYYAMELADDEETGAQIIPERYRPRTLRSEMQRRRRLPLLECIDIGLALSASLENLHQHGLIHRDVKPSNIVFVDGAPKLADIGLVTDSDVSVSFVGTEGFIPPEGPGTPQGDIYSLGKVLYEISTGLDRQAFPELPSSLAEAGDKELLELNVVIAKCCHPDPRRRYPTARRLYSDLSLLRRGQSVRFKRALQHNALVACWTAVAVLCCFGLAMLYFNLAPLLEARVIFRKSKSVNVNALTSLPQAPAVEPLAEATPTFGTASLVPYPLDLSRFYNARLDSPWHTPGGDARLNLAQFPAGLVRFGDTSFDARWIIQLAGSESEKQRLNFPSVIADIAIRRKARRVHFLHGAIWPASEGAHVGDYVVHYADEQIHMFPIIYGVDLRDWNVGSDLSSRVTRGKIVWSALQPPYAFRIFATTWTNPLPDEQITSLDFVSRMTPSAPFLIAVTLD